MRERPPVVAALTVAVALMIAAAAGCGSPDRKLSARPPASTAASAAAASAPAPQAASPAGPAPAPPPAPVVPAGVTAGIVVFDRQTGQFVYEVNPTTVFRSASLVKLLIVLDHTWAGTVPAADRARLDVMLRSSDDAAATYFWKRNGSRDVVARMVSRLGLVATAPPPADQPGRWGFTALSAGDVVRVYRYLLERAPAAVRDYVLGALRSPTPCGTDHYDQTFGIPSTVARPWAVKQGWSGFRETPGSCGATFPAAFPYAPGPALAPARAPGTPDMVGDVLHTTGVVGAGDRTIVAVLTVVPDRTPFAKATAGLTTLLRSLTLPGAGRLSAT